MLRRTLRCGYRANIWNTKAMSRCEARWNVTSSPSSRMLPSDGNSSPAIMRRVVVLPQPEGPSMTKKMPLSTVNVESLTAVNPPNCLRSFSTRICAMSSVRKVAHDHEAERAGQDRDEGVAVKSQRQRLHQREHDDRDEKQGSARRHRRPVLTAFADDDRDERRRGLRLAGSQQHGEGIFVPGKDQAEDRGRGNARASLRQHHFP